MKIIEATLLISTFSLMFVMGVIGAVNHIRRIFNLNDVE